MYNKENSQDLCQIIGVDYYPWPHDFTDEAKTQGISRAVPKTAIPFIDPGRTRIVFIHPKAIPVVTAEGMNLVDLGIELVNEHGEVYPDEDLREFVLTQMFSENQDWPMQLFCLLLREADRAKDLKRIESKYGLEYKSGFVGYAFLTGMHFVLPDDLDELPDELKGKGIEAVRVEYDYSSDE